MTVLDVLTVDRDLSRCADSWQRWQRALAVGEGLDSDPFVPYPSLTTRTALDDIRDLPEADPLRQPLLRWTYRLLEQRINLAVLVRRAGLRRQALHGFHDPEPGQRTITQLVHEVLVGGPRSPAWLAALAAVCGDLASVEALLWERRAELARRARLAEPDAVESPAAGIYTAAERWLTTTDEIAGELALRRLEDWLPVALATSAAEGWPARLSPRTLAELLRETTWLDQTNLEPGELPAAIAPASFLRALAQVGQAWGEARAPRHQPFVVAHDPYGLRSASFGARFALLPLQRGFVERSLGVGKPRVRDHARALGRALLLASRVAAARVLLRRSALAGARKLGADYEEITERALGFALTPRLAGVLLRLEVDDLARFAGLLAGAAAVEREVATHDEDYYRNPRAAESLRAEADLSPPPATTDEALAQGSAALARLLVSTC